MFRLCPRGISAMKSTLVLLACLCWMSTPAIARNMYTTEAEFDDEMRSLLASRQFEELDLLAARYRYADSRFPGGEPKLEQFYASLGWFPGTNGDRAINAGKVSFDQRKALLDKWRAADPDSLAARISLARLWINYAGEVRGTGYASSISGEQYRAFVQRLTNANEILRDLDPKLDPYIYSLRDVTALIAAEPEEETEVNYISAVHDFPNHFSFYTMQATNLEEKWFGKQGDVAKYLNSLLVSPGGSTGKIAYAIVASRLYHDYSRDQVFKKLGLQWSILKDAYSEQDRRFGLAEADLNAALLYSSLVHDDAFASHMFARIRSLAEQGFALDQKNLGYAYLWGNGVPGSPLDAVHWYRIAASHSDMYAEYQLGWIYEQIQPEGYPQGFAEALKWYQLSAAHGYSGAKNNIAYMYEHGTGVQQNYVKAAQLYQEAADQANERASFHLGTLYYRGLGVPQDKIKAYHWIQLAANLGDKEASEWLVQHSTEMLGDFVSKYLDPHDKRTP
jgi:TPR repeat protein